MTFEEILDQAVAMLQRRGRVTYRALKAQFQLDDDLLDVLKDELLFAYPVVDEAGRGLVWMGETAGVQVTTSQSDQTEPQPVVEQAQPAHVQTPSVEFPVPDAAERRQLTVMFCDLVGSTSLSGALDPEDFREVVRAYQSACTDVIKRYDGYVAQLLGDGLLVYFGYPQAHEDDVQRAVRSGLGIIEAIGTLNTHLAQAKGVNLAVRLGIHTGLVVVGEMGAEGRQEQLALGETPNLASRIQGIAGPDTVVMSEVTYRLIQGYFDCESLGEYDLRGVSQPMLVYRVLGDSGRQTRLDVASIRGLTPLIGRESEVTLLLNRWEQAREGHGQVMLLSGEAGIGKSRLVQALKAHVAEGIHTRLECQCSPYFTNSALYPIIDMMQRTWQFQADNTSEQKLEKLEQHLSQYRLPLEETVPLFAALLSLPVPEDRYPPLHLTPQGQRQKTLGCIVAVLLELAERQPVLLILEDLHWTDPTTLELLELCIDQTPTASLYILATCRPEFQPSWRHRSYLTEVTVHRLSPNQISHMAEQVAGGKGLPDDIIQQLVDKSDGVPLYVEEMTKALLESEQLKEADGHYALTGPMASLNIPATLQDSLMARLDRLVTAKAVAQYASAIGRQFSYELLQEVSQLDASMLQHELRRLVEAELIYQRGIPPQATYTFKHALIQDTAYESLLRRTRQGYHRRIAEVIEERFPEITEAQPELLAHHYAEAGLLQQAVLCGYRAGDEARKRSARVEALGYLTKALEWLASLPDTPEHARLELQVQLTLADVLSVLKGYAAVEAASAYLRARELCEQMGETSLPYLTVLRGLSRAYYSEGNLQQAQEVGEELLHLAQDQDDPTPLLGAHRTLAWVLFLRGEFSKARQHFEQNLTLHERIPQRRLETYLLSVQPASDLGMLAQTLWLLGYPDQALERSKTSLIMARNTSKVDGLANALCFAGMVHLFRREARSTWELSEEIIALATNYGLAQQLARGIMVRGIALNGQGQHVEGVAQIEDGLTPFRDTGGGGLTQFLSWLADAYGYTGRFEAAQSTLMEAISWKSKGGECFFEAELYRLQGELLLQQMTRDERQAETCCYQALAISRRQQAKSWELRAATSLSRLWQQQGRRQDAYDLLAPVYGWFTEGFDTADLKEAKALLDELK